MRNKRWLRAGLASLTVCGLALSAFVVACGDDDTGGAGVTPGTDAGGKTDSGGGGTDSGGGGTDSGGEKDAGPPPAKLQLINAATDLGPGDNGVGALRICYKVGPDADHLIWATLPPLPNRVAGSQPFPGLFAGTGGPVDGTGVSLEALVVKPYLVSAFSLEKHGFGKTITPDTEKDCQSILEGDAGGAGAFVQNTDFWILDPVPAGAFKNGNSYLLALTGCAGGSTAGTTKCGGDPGAAPGIGNLKISVFKVDNTTKVDSDKLGVQFVSLSPNLEGFLGSQSGGTLHTRPSIQSDKANAATAKLIAATTEGGDAGGDVAPLKFTSLLQVSGVNNGSDFLMANPNVAQVAYTLPQTAALSFGVADGKVYANGKAFTVVAVGDISGDPDGGNGGATFNTKFFHFLALPNDPTVKTFDPSK
jgi:hypothetical protein